MASRRAGRDTDVMTMMEQGPLAGAAAQAAPVNTTLLHVAHWNEVDALIRQADLKAQVLLGIDALLLAGLSRSADVSVAGVAPVDSFLEFLTLGLLLTSIAMALVTIAPRRGQQASPDALLYFQAISQMDPAAFADAYTAMTPDDFVRKVAFEIHAKSGVAARKLSRIRMGVLLLAAASTAWSIALVVGL